MKLLYLGTAAAEGIPAAFCSCPVCTNARRQKGRELRSRSQVLLDGELLIDFPPDPFYHAALHDLNFGSIHTLLVTHDHMDHWFPTGLINRHSAYQKGADGILHVYGNEAVGRSFESHLKTELYAHQPLDAFVQFHCVHGSERFQCGAWEITAIPADHDPRQECLIYLCKKGGKTVLYGHDTGSCLTERAWELLSGARIDLLSLDGTMGRESCPYNHMGLPDVEHFVATLREMGCADAQTRCIVSHFSHNGGMTQAELASWGSQHGIVAAYDGMELSI